LPISGLLEYLPGSSLEVSIILANGLVATALIGIAYKYIKTKKVRLIITATSLFSLCLFIGIAWWFGGIMFVTDATADSRFDLFIVPIFMLLYVLYTFCVFGLITLSLSVKSCIS